jgi:rod shape-determining protein MreD
MRIFHQWVLAIALFVALVLDGVLAWILHPLLAWGNLHASLCLLPIGVMMIALFDDLNGRELYLAIGAGIVADIYYFGFIGIYTVALPVLCWLGQKIARFLPEVFIVRLLLAVVGVIGLQLYSWLVFAGLSMTTATGTSVLFSILYTIPWTIVLTCLSYVVWARLATAYPFLVDLDAYQQ